MNQADPELEPDTEIILSYFSRKGSRHTVTFADLIHMFGFSQPHTNAIVKELIRRRCIVKVGHGCWRRVSTRLRIVRDLPPVEQLPEPELDPFVSNLLERRSRTEKLIQEAQDWIGLYTEEIRKLRAELPIIERLLTMTDMGLL